MGLLSSSKSSKKITNITNTTNESTAQQGGDGSLILGKGASFTSVNPDARSIIAESNAFVGETFSSALGLVERQNQSFLEGVAEGTIETGGDKIARLTPIVMVIAIAGSAYFLMRG